MCKAQILIDSTKELDRGARENAESLQSLQQAAELLDGLEKQGSQWSMRVMTLRAEALWQLANHLRSDVNTLDCLTYLRDCLNRGFERDTVDPKVEAICPDGREEDYSLPSAILLAKAYNKLARMYESLTTEGSTSEAYCLPLRLQARKMVQELSEAKKQQVTKVIGSLYGIGPAE